MKELWKGRSWKLIFFFFFFFFFFLAFHFLKSLKSVWGLGQFLPGKSIFHAGKKSGKVTLPPPPLLLENISLTSLGTWNYAHSPHNLPVDNWIKVPVYGIVPNQGELSQIKWSVLPAHPYSDPALQTLHRYFHLLVVFRTTFRHLQAWSHHLPVVHVVNKGVVIQRNLVWFFSLLSEILERKGSSYYFFTNNVQFYTWNMFHVKDILENLTNRGERGELAPLFLIASSEVMLIARRLLLIYVRAMHKNSTHIHF